MIATLEVGWDEAWCGHYWWDVHVEGKSRVSFRSRCSRECKTPDDALAEAVRNSEPIIYKIMEKLV